MAALPEPVHSTVAAIVELHAKRIAAEKPRAYLGCSTLGHECERFLWLEFHGARRRAFDGRVARMFETGHREEARMIEEMRAAGITVWDRDGNGEQWSVQALGGHVRGHLDAVVRGLPEAPKTPHVWDAKTAKAEKFRALVKHGIRKSHPQYYAQGILYMGLMEVERAAFLFSNKDTDELHLERFDFDQAEFDKLMARAKRVIFGTEPGPRAGDSADAVPCKWCDFQSICWGTDVPPAGCRTCVHATPVADLEDGEWDCAANNREVISLSVQRTGCAKHRVIPILLERFAEPVDSDGDAVTYRHRESGREFVNGPGGFSSAEIAACADKAALVDEEIKTMREEFDGAIVG